MRELLKKSSTFTRIEFWVLTTIFAFVIFFFITDGVGADDPPFEEAWNKRYFDKANVPFRYYKNYFYPQFINYIIQFSYVFLLNFLLIPRLLKKKGLIINIFLILLAFTLAGLALGLTYSLLKGYLYAENLTRDRIDLKIFQDGFENALMITWILTVYTAIKYGGIYLLAISEKIEAKYKYIRKEAIVAAVIWIILLFFLRIGQAETHLVITWAIVIPSAIALYLYSFYRLIPRSLARRKFQFLSYLFKCALIILGIFIVIYLVSVIITQNDGNACAEYSAFNTFFQFFVTVPITWFLYKRHIKGNEEINVLQKELGRSNANLDFLRSQINPHFLFNALNTIYGTAIQEKAERTSEGIEKLGDMMRFMLQENMQEKISLAREVEYLNNYIDLQRLRTDINPNISIDASIQQEVHTLQIAPMLLIPFVENAFKHGISFREPSYIKITMEVNDKTLYFDVSNSKHIKTENDPEKNKSGIGLNNVKQRLHLLYKGKHELMIRETTKDFFVHLTLQLS